MVIKNVHTMKCPKCGQELKIDIWNGFNVSENMEIKAKILSGEAFYKKCSNCEARVFINYDMIYHDDENDLMIYLEVEDEVKDDKIVETYIKTTDVNHLAREEYLMRIVRSPEQLREKIYIFDQGLDDRTIEVMKIFILRKVMDDSSSDVKPEVAEIVLRTEKDNAAPTMFLIRTTDNKIGYYPFLAEMYEDIEKNYFTESPRGKQDYVVNFVWASEFIRNMLRNINQ